MAQLRVQTAFGIFITLLQPACHILLYTNKYCKYNWTGVLSSFCHSICRLDFTHLKPMWEGCNSPVTVLSPLHSIKSKQGVRMTDSLVKASLVAMTPSQCTCHLWNELMGISLLLRIQQTSIQLVAAGVKYVIGNFIGYWYGNSRFSQNSNQRMRISHTAALLYDWSFPHLSQ